MNQKGLSVDGLNFLYKDSLLEKNLSSHILIWKQLPWYVCLDQNADLDFWQIYVRTMIKLAKAWVQLCEFINLLVSEFDLREFRTLAGYGQNFLFAHQRLQTALEQIDGFMWYVKIACNTTKVSWMKFRSWNVVPYHLRGIKGCCTAMNKFMQVSMQHFIGLWIVYY